VSRFPATRDARTYPVGRTITEGDEPTGRARARKCVMSARARALRGPGPDCQPGRTPHGPRSRLGRKAEGRLALLPQENSPQCEAPMSRSSKPVRTHGRETSASRRRSATPRRTSPTRSLDEHAGDRSRAAADQTRGPSRWRRQVLALGYWETLVGRRRTGRRTPVARRTPSSRHSCRTLCRRRGCASLVPRTAAG